MTESVADTPRASSDRPATYAEAGVDIDAGERAVDLIKPMVASTRRPEVVGGLGDFGGLFRLDTARYDRPVLVAATDGVGTKLVVAQDLGRLDTIGIDLVAMCVDDLVCQGAEPLFFLDYISAGAVEPPHMAALVAGVADGCRQVGAALLGGEMAEHAGIMQAGEFDLVGFAVGVVDQERILGSARVVPGDVLIGLPSPGLRCNGYTLARHVLLERSGLALDAPAWEGAEVTVGDELLRPSVIYTPAVRAAIDAADVHAVAHITGGGFAGNIPRALPGDPGRGRAGVVGGAAHLRGDPATRTGVRRGDGPGLQPRARDGAHGRRRLGGRRPRRPERLGPRPGGGRPGRGGRARGGPGRTGAVGGHGVSDLPDTRFEALRAHLLEHSVKRGDFTLKSGRKSSWFIDSKQTVCRPEAMVLVADGILSVLPDDVDAIGGLTMGADPVAFVTAGVAATRGRGLKAFSVRKEAKDHGAGGRIAGALDPGDRVVITEDTVTRGTSLLEAAHAVLEAGAHPVLLVAVVDRGGTCAAMAAAEGLEFTALLSAPDLGFDYEGA